MNKTMTLNEGVGHRIKQERQSLGLSQREFAEKLDVSPGLVGQWENHTKSPGRENLRKISLFTGKTIDELLGDNSSDTAPITIWDDDEKQLVMLFRRLPRPMKENALKFLGMALDFRRKSQQKSAPLKIE
ncbi:helix-turn-helix domain-containing protein [Acidocella sp.]|uniref:helix-turn-helix domain-containing protein n=1 Tax=Acidocella sp. TaxID=50710 RepID=UPI0026067C2C|nr:helix-turn-helix transcriptional regulator [Acidocella sp.]